jgi:hypothetical protein
MLVLYLFSVAPEVGVLLLIVTCVLIAVGIYNANQTEKQKKCTEEENKKKFAIELEEKGFNATKKLALGLWLHAPVMQIDTDSKRIAICDYLKSKLTILSFSEILDCEVLEDSSTILSGGVGRAAVGGMIAGGTGAVVGAATRKSKNVTNSLSIKIITTDIDDSLMVFDLITSETSRDSDLYKKSIYLAQEIHSTLISIIKTQQNSQLVAEEQSPKQAVAQLSTEDTVNQLKLLNDLKSQGIITEEEYNQKREKLVEAL